MDADATIAALTSPGRKLAFWQYQHGTSGAIVKFDD
jgi:hypothetical protein